MSSRGRFAPTPSGPLHFGSLLAAVASYLEAKSKNGEWLVRIEDNDTVRTIPGAADDILRTLEAFGFEWDGEVVWQSQRSELYRDALEHLRARGLVYRCTCSRKRIGEGLRRGVDGAPVYSGACRFRVEECMLPLSNLESGCYRLLTQGISRSFCDRLMGCFTQDVEHDVGDFVLLRADGCYTYHLAVVVDDALQGVTEIVRGSDLIPSTARQIYLQDCLDYTHPNYCHIPVAANADGEKLSKQTKARALNVQNASQELARALAFLGHTLPGEVCQGRPQEILAFARKLWSLERVPAVLSQIV